MRRRLTTRPVVVVGAGASGLLTTRALLRAGHPSVVLVERDATWSAGPAYATRDAQHLLNVPAGNLSVDGDEPLDFVDWASRRMPGVTPCAFLPRAQFGAYLRESLATTARNARHSRLVRITAAATSVDPAPSTTFDAPGPRVHLDAGRSIDAAHVVLALGNPRPRPLAGDAEHVIEDPWSPGAFDRVAPDDVVVMVGSGLTAIDVALTLVAHRQSRVLRMVSRRGLLPRAHHPQPTRPPREIGRELPSPLTARSATAWLRAAIVEADGDWQAVFDAVRPRTNEIWSLLPERERIRLTRLAGRYWEVHRHRAAPEVATQATRLIASGRLHVGTGAVECVERVSRGASRVVVRDARGARSTIDAHWVVNCTGPDFDVRRSGGAILRGLLDRGRARSGPLGLGLDVAPDGALVDRAGRAAATVSVVGPLRRGSEWETTAIPEIRAQAEQVAARIAASGVPAPPRRMLTGPGAHRALVRRWGAVAEIDR